MTSVDSAVQSILDRAIEGQRLTPEDGLALIRDHQLARLGQAANLVTQRMHPESYRTYNIDRNINYTNICSAVCDFCAFTERRRAPRAMCLTAKCSSKK
jgi:cyclic dehypoxanthinyl futalosine synthase